MSLTKDFGKQLQKIEKQIQSDINSQYAKAIRDLSVSVLAYSPVRTGKYIYTHRFAINGKDNGAGTSYNTNVPSYITGYPEALSAISDWTINSLDDRMDISIINDVQGPNPYWQNIEYTGWKSGKPPYRTFQKSVKSAEAKNQILSDDFQKL